MRLRLGLSQDQLAQALELSGAGIISRWEDNRTFPSPRNVKKLIALSQEKVPDEPLLFADFYPHYAAGQGRAALADQN